MKIYFPLLLTLLIHSVLCEDTDTLLTKWKAWKAKYRKNYSESEDGKRFNIWKDNFEVVQKHNRKHQRGESTYEMGMTSLAALTKEEFRSMLMPRTIALNVPDELSYKRNFSTSDDLPQTVAWENTDYVTPVKDQGSIGSCYSFSAVEAVEGQFSLQTGVLTSFSEQQIVDCDQGGDGGYPYRVYRYLIQCGGLQTETAYPYKGKVSSCEFELDKAVATLKSFRFVTPTSDESALQSAVAQVGPISISPIKIFYSFMLYKSGVYYEPKCNDPNLDGQGYHAMLATGYGTTDDGEEYWMVKNSWGTGWGENGYIKMARNRDDNCGVAKHPTYPIMTSSQTKMANLGDGGKGFALIPSIFTTILAGCFSLLARNV